MTGLVLNSASRSVQQAMSRLWIKDRSGCAAALHGVTLYGYKIRTLRFKTCSHIPTMCGVRTLAASTNPLSSFNVMHLGLAEVQAPRPELGTFMLLSHAHLLSCETFFVQNSQCLLTRMTCTSTVAGHRVFVRYLVLLPMLCSVGSLLWVKRVWYGVASWWDVCPTLCVVTFKVVFPRVLFVGLPGDWMDSGVSSSSVRASQNGWSRSKGPRSSPLVW